MSPEIIWVGRDENERLLVELAVEGWLARHAWTREEAIAYRDIGPIACGCSGPPIPGIAGFPCTCELNTMLTQAALGEEVTGWEPGPDAKPPGATWRERLAYTYAPKPEPSWPKGKPRPLP